MSMLRDRLTILTAATAGVFMVVQYFVTSPGMDATYRAILNWMQVIFACALMVGIAAVVKNHIVRLRRRRAERPYSLVLLASVAAMASMGFSGGIDQGSSFLWAFNHLQAPMQATVFSLLAFYVTSAAFRGFRARSVESAVLIAAGLIVLIGRVPLGEQISAQLPAAAEWIVNVPALAAKRAILIGIGLGMVATALKVIAGVERTYLGGR
ncbi:MAG TPA: hypothetical protein VNN55_00470 [bacterium]|nr:hypothetical protein [bacterium]